MSVNKCLKMYVTVLHYQVSHCSDCCAVCHIANTLWVLSNSGRSWKVGILGSDENSRMGQFSQNIQNIVLCIESSSEHSSQSNHHHYHSRTSGIHSWILRICVGSGLSSCFGGWIAATWKVWRCEAVVVNLIWSREEDFFITAVQEAVRFSLAMHPDARALKGGDKITLAFVFCSTFSKSLKLQRKYCNFLQEFFLCRIQGLDQIATQSHHLRSYRLKCQWKGNSRI